MIKLYYFPKKKTKIYFKKIIIKILKNRTNLIKYLKKTKEYL